MRIPFVLANWKMMMTQRQIEDYVSEFTPLVTELLQKMDIVLCPPFTGIFPLRLAVNDLNVQIGAQNLHPGPEETYTGEVSAPLLADAGVKWVMLGHSERRRMLCETDETVHQKVIAAVSNGLKPVLLIGEPVEMTSVSIEFLNQKLSLLLNGLTPTQVASSVIMYEPEEAIGVFTTVSPGRVTTACSYMREWICSKFGKQTADAVRLVYGGSVNPENSQSILGLKEVDGLGAGRHGRDAHSFANIARQMAHIKGIL